MDILPLVVLVYLVDLHLVDPACLVCPTHPRRFCLTALQTTVIAISLRHNLLQTLTGDY